MVVAGGDHPQHAGLVHELQVPALLILFPQLRGPGRHLCVRLVRSIGSADHASLATRRGARVARTPCVHKVTARRGAADKAQSIPRRRPLRLPRYEFSLSPWLWLLGHLACLSIFVEGNFRKGNQPARVLAPPTAAPTFNNHRRENETMVLLVSQFCCEDERSSRRSASTGEDAHASHGIKRLAF